MTVAVGSIVEGSTIAFVLNAQKDGATWDLTAATVSLYLRDPYGSWSAANSATLTNASAGIATYTTTTSDLNYEGQWARQWAVTQGGVTLRYPAIYFDVSPFEP